MATAQAPTSLAQQYDPAAIEGATYAAWEADQAFASTPRPDREGYCILLPPPNVTGSLHMGHAFQHAIMDALIRQRRMHGDDVLWQAGTDHAGVGTHIVVTRYLHGQGIDPATLSREEFYAKVLEWKEASASTITSQMRRLGDSCDWERECFTLDPQLSDVVRDVFIQLYEEGLIYRGKRLVNWDPQLLTALADLEVVSKEEDGTLYHVRYPFVDPADGEGMVIATTRPETILVDGALAVAPGDERFVQFLGKRVRVPCTERDIVIIADEHVDPEFGSGCVKITAAHDFNDYEVAQRHPEVDIPIIELMTPTAQLNDNAPPEYRGLDRYAARAKIVADLADQGLLIKSEPHRYMLPRGERSGVVVEPMLSDQWYLRTETLAAQALATVAEGRLRFVPDRWRTVYANWLNEIKDWCISRQIDWGHRIPAWLDAEGQVFVGVDAAAAQAQAGDERELTQVDDVLDTWFSSALWPLSTLGWPHVDADYFRHYFPTSTLVTGNDIIFFWVARMVMLSEHLMGATPFHEVYMHGLVRDRNGDKMSKSRGNVLDPLDLIDGITLAELLAKRNTPELRPEQAKLIAKRTRKEYPDGIQAYGTDALRLTFASLASHGRDVNFDLGRIDGHRRLCTKLWQASRFVLGVVADPLATSAAAAGGGVAERWMRSRVQRAAAACANHFKNYRFDLLVEELTALLRDDFCDWYIELAKVSLAATAQAPAVRQTLVETLGAILRLAHPIIPFITNELWQHVGPLSMPDHPKIMTAPYPVAAEQLIDEPAEAAVAALRQVVHDCRSLRVTLGVEPARRLPAQLEAGSSGMTEWAAQLARLARLEPLRVVEKLAASADEPVLATAGCRLQLELGTAGSGWRERLQTQLTELHGQLRNVTAKLANEDFVTRAPAEVVTVQRNRRGELEEKMGILQELLDNSATG